MFLTDASDATLLSTFRTGIAPGASPSQRRDSDRAVVELIDRHRARAFDLRNRVTPSLSDETVEDVLTDAVLIKSRHERLFRLDGDAQYGTWLHRVLRNALIAALRKQTRIGGYETTLSLQTSDGEEVERGEVSSDDTYGFIADDALRVVLDTIDELAATHRMGEEISRAFILRHLHTVAFPDRYSRQPGRGEVMDMLGVSERRARTLVDHADALLTPFREAVAEKFGQNRPAEPAARV